MDGIVRPICMAILTGEKYEVLNHDGSGVPNFCNFETTQIAAGVKPSHRLDVSSSQVCSPCEVGICKVFGKKNMSNALNKSRGCGTMEDCNGKQPRPVQSSAAKRRARAWLETAASTSRWRFFRGAGCKLFSSCACNLARKMLMNSSHHPIPLKSS